MRPIDADAVYNKALENHQKGEIEDWEFDSIINYLDGAPTINAAEIVYCKDCIRRYDTDECPMCFLIEGKYYEYTNGNGFCDRGERKEGTE